MWKVRNLVLVLFVVLPVIVQAGLFDGGQAEKADQIQFFVDLGVLKYGKTFDASGSREILILTKDGTGIFTHQHLTEADGKDFEAILRARGLLREAPNTETGKPEKQLMVFNPKDKSTYEWVPVKKLKETRDRIKETGNTVPVDAPSKRVTEKSLTELNFDLKE